MRSEPSKPRGAKKKSDRLITGEVVLNLGEAKTSIINFWVQPSLKDAFVQACQMSPRSPEVPADVLREYMLDYVEAHKARQKKAEETQ